MESELKNPPQLGNVYCERCGGKVAVDAAVWLQLNTETGEHRLDPWPADVDQETVALSDACAQRVLDNCGQLDRSFND